MLPTKEGKGVGVALFKPGNIAIEECDTADKVKSMVKDNFPQFQDVIPEKAFAEFANQRVQRLPIFQYAANSLVGPQTALVGDSIHTVKPYFGLGVNSAFEDIGVLRDSLQTLQTSLGTLDSSLERYSESHKHNAKAMVQMSRTFDQGFLKFVLPLILDTFFHKLLPQVFSTNCIRILQQHDLPFAQAGAIKRRDRALQIAIISTFQGKNLFLRLHDLLRLTFTSRPNLHHLTSLPLSPLVSELILFVCLFVSFFLSLCLCLN